jgi:hypothetical protein
MIISPPFLPQVEQPQPPAPASPEESPPAQPAAAPEDPLMDAADDMAQHHGTYPIAWDRGWHTGVHLVPGDQHMPVRAIADGTVVAYRVCDKPLPDMSGNLNSNGGFVLLRHQKETGNGRTLRFYSLYMHLLDTQSMNTVGLPPVCSNRPHEMPLWAQCPTGEAVSGIDETVLRKDILGYMGKCSGMWELHFEIFMTQEDFAAYFGPTQLGAAKVATPAGRDCWGHTYYVIPAGQRFHALPVNFTIGPDPQRLEDSVTLQDVKPKGNHGTIGFERINDGTNASTLYVEVFFCLGSKYTNVWSETPEGLKSLTPQPVCEQGYEYVMYERARDLYGLCPSDGYELLRFGRILESVTLPASPPSINTDLACPVQADHRQTWFRITFASGQEGYIDINAKVIQKVSDADFPAFMGWQKIHDKGHAPGTPAPGPQVAAPRRQSDSDGRWNPHALMDLLGKMAAKGSLDQLVEWVRGTGQAPAQKTTTMRQVVNDPVVRDLLKGFICEASSEWDAASLEQRYGWLRHTGERFENNQADYSKFTQFVQQFQFWDKTGLPAGTKLWYFHPLGFIRHFRKCSWLAKPEMQQLLPMNYMTESGGPYPVDGTRSNEFITRSRISLNNTLCKYGITTPARMAAFFGQAIVETSWFRSMAEGGGNNARYAPWYGRGFLQLTNSDGGNNLESSNYYSYFRWRGCFPEHASPAQIIQWRENVADSAKDDVAQSAGFYWIFPQFRKPEHHAERTSYYADAPSANVRVAQGSHAYYSNESARKVAAYVNIPGAIYGTSKVNNLPERYSCYANALVVLADTPVFPAAHGQQNGEVPEGFTLRYPW